MAINTPMERPELAEALRACYVVGVWVLSLEGKVDNW